MKNKFIALFITAAFVLSAVGFVFSGENVAAKGNNELVGLLPASDIVINLDAQRLLNTALPQILSADVTTLTQVNAKIDEFKEKTGLDMRQFQQVSAGISMIKDAKGGTDFEPFVLARGSFSASALVLVAKLASGGKYKTKKIGNRTVYIFTAKDVIDKNKPNKKNSMLDKLFNALSKEVAVTAYDANTLAIGTESRLRETFEKKTTVNNEILGLVYQNPSAVVTFGGKLPDGLSGVLDLDDDFLGLSINSIRQVSGALTVENNQAVVALTARTLKEDQAQLLHDTLTDLLVLGKSFLGGSKSGDKQVYRRMVENAKINIQGNQLSLNLEVPQSDIDILLGKK